MNPETGSFADRHLGPRPAERDQMLATIGVPTLDALMDEAIPASIRLDKPLALPEGESEHQFLARLRDVARRNRVFRSYIGLGYYDTITPGVILRTIFENPSWYTPYTPYQAEISQGRLEALLTFQTVVRDLTAMEIANASLLDEPTAAAEAMTMMHRVQARQGGDERNVLLVSDQCYPQTVDVVRGRAEPAGISVVVAPIDSLVVDAKVFGVLVQNPDANGAIVDLTALIERAHAAGALVAVATDLLSLTLMKPPGEMGADVVLGNAQRFGVPMGYGGPHAAFFATREAFVRQAPGRIIGVSVDAQGNRAYRMALQTREQHIRREKATSNICTAQALLATMAGMYAVYHGPDGLHGIGRRVHALATSLDAALTGIGCRQVNAAYFDTVRFAVPDGRREQVRQAALKAGMNFRYLPEASEFTIALDETSTAADVLAIVEAVASGLGRHTVVVKRPDAHAGMPSWPAALVRQTTYLTHPVFHSHRSETAMMRFIKNLEKKDVGLDTSMIPLGSCTMKLTGATEIVPVSWPEFAGLHPFVPTDQAAGYAFVFKSLSASLEKITGLAAVSLQPNSGAQGEFTGLMVIRAYHQARGDHHRNVVLIPSSAHGTNPASAVMAGMTVVVVACDSNGNVDVADLKAKATEHRANLAALMITYPSTHGVFEDAIIELCRVVHENGGQVYMDGANLNAQVGLTSPGRIGADVCHLNLHKTFAIPHGGGGPGHGTDRRGRSPGAVPAGPCPRPGRRRQGDPRRCRGAVGQRERAADLVRVHLPARRRGCHRGDEVRDLERELHQVAARGALPGALYEPEGESRARDDLRPARLQEGRDRGDRRREAPDGLRLPRADRVVPRSGHTDDRADRERAETGTRPVLRRADCHSRRNSGGAGRQGGPEGQRPEAFAAHHAGGIGR